MRLSKDFTLEEFLSTSAKADNTSTPEAKMALAELVTNVLQPARDMLKIPITVTSGYRNDAVNKAVGGATGSQHTKGEAADVVCEDNRRLFDVIRNSFVFDQLIWEHGDDNAPSWVHVSYRTQGNRGEVLRATKEKGKVVYKRNK